MICLSKVKLLSKFTSTLFLVSLKVLEICAVKVVTPQNSIREEKTNLTKGNYC